MDHTGNAEEAKMNRAGELDGFKRYPGKDPRNIVTPAAFSVAPELLYTPLAKPWKRALAITIDGLLIAVLAEQAGPLFVLLVCLLAYYIHNHANRISTWAKGLLYLFMAVVLLWSAVPQMIKVNGLQERRDNEIQGQTLLTLTPQLLRLSLCEYKACAQHEAGLLVNAAAEAGLSRTQVETMLQGALDDLPLAAADIAAINADLLPQLASMKTESVATLNAQTNVQANAKTDAQAKPAPTEDDSRLEAEEDEQEEEAQYSLLAWAKGMLNDLGLGFGWAAFYFTLFTAWFDGQTLGKKIMRVRVIALGGGKLSLWDAFGRYGGYGAGFATGLLGFLQIFWDANRQAIQDKISATVVIDLSKPRVSPTETMLQADPVTKQ
ncbi:RDD family protein [Shewanella chilikensis]|uniref:RDD family protein n=3 Tax=Shewanella chilikensis TaxID=558541 RepID=A0ABX5PP10_9GAMM|nr:RDD family protein [Shewanella chilikensis]GGZ28689.1 RDD domain protein [Shewanella chilikensis]